MEHIGTQWMTMKAKRRSKAAPSSTQRGSTAVAMLLMMLGLITMLGLVEVGYLYWAKRDTQKVADLAALAGAQQLSACIASNQNNTAASGNATTENKFTGTLTITCGTWDPVANSGITDHFSTVASGVSPNAVKVIAQRSVLPIWGMAGKLPNVSAEAVATGLQPIAVFTVGSTLATVTGKSPLGQLLTGIGLNIPEASLVGYSGVATATLTPSGLLNALGVSVPANITVGGLNQLLATTVSAHALVDVLNAAVTAAGQTQLLSANATLVSAVTASLGSAPGTVTLGSNGATPTGLFAQIVAPDSAAQTALNARVNLLSVISTAVGVATNQHAISVPNTTVSLPPLSATVQAGVIEPPAIGIGGAGTTAYTAQVRLFTELKLSTSSIPLIGGLVSPLVNVNLDIPIAVDLVNAQATLNDLCVKKNAAGNDLATITVNSSVLKTCVGNVTAASAFSSKGACDQIAGFGDKNLLNVTLGTNTVLANVTTHFSLTALTATGSDTFTAGETENLPTNGTALNIGSTVSNLMTALTTVLLGTTVGNNTTGIAANLATDLWNANVASHTGANPNLNQLQAALNQLSGSTSALGSFLQNTSTQVSSILTSTLTLNLGGVISGAGSLVGGVLNLVGGILGDVGCTLGSAACVAVIKGALQGNAPSGVSNGLIGVLGFVLQTLQGPLNTLGANVLTPVLNNTLGIDLGVSTVNLQSLQCHGVQLVY
jgi:uncharacterized membrane protein